MKKKDSDLYQNGSVSFNDKQSGQRRFTSKLLAVTGWNCISDRRSVLWNGKK